MQRKPDGYRGRHVRTGSIPGHLLDAWKYDTVVLFEAPNEKVAMNMALKREHLDDIEKNASKREWMISSNAREAGGSQSLSEAYHLIIIAAGPLGIITSKVIAAIARLITSSNKCYPR